MDRRRVATIVLLALALVLPLVVSATKYATYVQHIATQILLMGLYAMAWDFLNGYVGLFSFGHSAFFGAGAYATAILVVRGGITSAPLVLAVALLAAIVVGLIVGALAARVGNVAVFLVTFASAEAFYLLILSDPRGLTNGDNGLPGVAVGPWLGFEFTNKTTFYYVALTALTLSYVALQTLTRSRFGQVLVGIRENELRMRFAGYHVEQYKTAAFVVSAAFAGLAGSLTALQERIASPEKLAWTTSSEAVLYTILGGTATLIGPVLGTAIVVVVREVLSDLFKSWLILVGLTYIALVFFLPSGLYPLVFRSDRRQ